MLVGRRVVVATNNDSAYEVASALAEAGADVTLVDIRRDGTPATPANGSAITCSAGCTITVSATRDGKRTIFSVTDTGRGIPKEAQSRIFDKFQQVRPGDRSAGYGLGLAVAKFIVEAHKGTLRYRPQVAGGACFMLRLPHAQGGA